MGELLEKQETTLLEREGSGCAMLLANDKYDGRRSKEGGREGGGEGGREEGETLLEREGSGCAMLRANDKYDGR